MRRCSRGASSSVVLVAGAAILLVIHPASGQTPTVAAAPEADRIVAIVTGLRNDNGVVRMSLYDGPARWPRPHGGVECRQRIAHRQATCIFASVMRGRAYAIGITHDENDNGRVDTNAIGIPTEGYGFSNNARPRMAAPGFNACRFVYSGGVMHIRMFAQY